MADPIPSDIPEDVWESARSHMARVGWHARSMILGAANAILAERDRLTDPAFLQRCLDQAQGVGAEAVAEAIATERERCAQVAEAVGSDHDPRLADYVALRIRSSTLEAS